VQCEKLWTKDSNWYETDLLRIFVKNNNSESSKRPRNFTQI
ncbi:6976_t:CDS:1, partial [Funneliformis caledonium]